MLRDRQRDGPGGLRGPRVHGLVPVHHAGDGGHGCSGGDLCKSSCFSHPASTPTRDAVAAPADHSRSSSSPRAVALATSAQRHPGPQLVLVATVPPEPSQLFSHETASCQEMNPVAFFSLAFQGKISVFFPVFRNPLHGYLSERNVS